MSDVLPQSFLYFIAPHIDRFEMLFNLLRDRALSPTTVELADSRLIVVTPERTPVSSKPRTVLVAHYDRAADSPGANDNSAAVFQLMATATRLRAEGTDGWVVVFTDREESAGAAGARSQGAYALAEGFKAIGLSESHFFIFDACGRGDTIIVSTTVESLNIEAKHIKRNARELRLRALETGRLSSGGRILLAPTPFSDDAGFLAAGIAAQTITLLPAKEAAALARELRNKPDYASSLINKRARDALEPRAYKTFMPDTWKRLHGKADDAQSLTPASFPLIERFAHDLINR
ncbi:MAG: M28 family peptidase [Treponemataceae bacterium]